MLVLCTVIINHWQCCLLLASFIAVLGWGWGQKAIGIQSLQTDFFPPPKDFIFNGGGGMCTCGRCLQRPEKGVGFPVAGVKSTPELPSVGADPLEALRS